MSGDPGTDQTTPGTDGVAGGGDKYQEALRRFSGDLRMIKQVFESMQERDVEVRESHWRLLLQAHLDGRDLPGAREVMAQMRAAGVEPAPATQWDVAIALGRSGRAEEAMALVEKLEQAGVHVGPERAAGALGLFINVGEFGRAKQMLRQMADHGRAAQPARYERLIEDCLRRQAINDSQDLVELMIDAGAPPAAERATELVAMMAAAGHPDRAVRVRETLAEAGVEIDRDAHTELLRAFAEQGEPERAGEVLVAMQRAGGDVTSFHANAMLTARLQAGEHEAAWSTAMGLASDGRIPTSRNLEGLLDASLEVGNTTRAGGAIDWMLMLGAPAPPEKVGETVVRHLEQDQLDVGLGLYRQTVARGVPGDRRAARRLVDALVSADRLGQARGFLHELRKAGTLTHGKHYGSLLAAYVRGGRFDEAVTLLQHMLLADITPTVADASRVVVALAEQAADRARELLDELLEAGIEVGEPTFRELMWAYARAGRAGPVREVLEQMTQAGFEADDRHQKALEWASGETPRRLEDRDDEPGPAPDQGAAEPQDGSRAPGPASGSPPPSPAEEVLASIAGDGTEPAVDGVDEPSGDTAPAAPPSETDADGSDADGSDADGGDGDDRPAG